MRTHSKLIGGAFGILMQNARSDIVPLSKHSRIVVDGHNKARNSLMIAQQEDSTEAIWINPCTGEPSNDVIPDDELDCLQKTGIPTLPPLPFVPIIEDDDDDDELIDKIICPGEVCLFDEEASDDNNLVLVEFKYTVETTKDTEDVTSLLPQLEETLLKKLAEKLLAHCFEDGFDFTLRKLAISAIGNAPKVYRRRNLKSPRRLLETILGICSAPVDKPVTDETCEPELDEDNNCFVIEGGVTVSIDTDDDDNIVETVTNATKDAMDKDELLTDDNPEVKKVKFWEEEDDGVPVGAQPVAGGGELPIYLAASFGFLALLIGGYALRKKRNHTESTEDEAKTVSSFVGVVGLGNHASTMDVHQCTSATCPKCYVNRSIMFVDAPTCQPAALPTARVFEEAETGDNRWDGPSIAGASTLDVSTIQLGSGSLQSSSFDSVDFSS